MTPGSSRYNVVATRLEPGRYQLSYGRGSRKLTDTVQVGPDGKWRIDSPIAAGRTFARMQDARELWGQWAVQQYGKDRPPLEPPPTAASLQPGEHSPGPDAERPRIIDGIPHRYQPMPPGHLSGLWCWIGQDGLNPAERRTSRFWSQE
jgi:hypothetical protein